MSVPVPVLYRWFDPLTTPSICRLAAAATCALICAPAPSTTLFGSTTADEPLLPKVTGKFGVTVIVPLPAAPVALKKVEPLVSTTPPENAPAAALSVRLDPPVLVSVPVPAR